MTVSREKEKSKMGKKIFFLTAAILLVLTSCSGCVNDNTVSGVSEVSESGISDFDETNIIFSFAALSDVHISAATSALANTKYTKALEKLKEYSLDAVCIAGDLTDSGSQTEINNFKHLYESFMPDIPLVYCMGNHDGQDGAKGLLFATEFGENYFTNDKYANYSSGNRHVVINGYHFVCVETQNYYGGEKNCYYSDATKQWLSETLTAIKEEDETQPIFVFTHPMIYDTAYGSDLPGSGTMWYSEDLISILSNYPTVVSFSGHVHHPLNDERSIMQTSFTSLGCGSVSYMAIESGYVQTGSTTVPSDAQQYSQGLVVQIDANGAIKFVRLDFYDEAEIKQAWVVAPYDSELEFLGKYTKARAETNEAPIFDTDSASLTLKAAGESFRGTVAFNAAEDDDLVHHYAFTVYEGENEKRTIKLLSDFYLEAQVSNMKKTHACDIGLLDAGTEYTLEVYAVDSWGAKSNVYTYTFTTKGTKPDDEDNEAQLYANITFNDEGASDSEGKITCTNNSASFTDGKAVISAAGQNICCTFNDFASSADTASFLNDGFSIETVFINKNVGGTQGVVCSTQSGGWGLATSASGEIYFIVSNGSYVSVYSGVTASEKTHVIAVYDPSEEVIRIYINGEKKAESAVTGSLISGTSAAYNTFYIGADIDSAGTGNDFQMTDFESSYVRIYTSAINNDQAFSLNAKK